MNALPFSEAGGVASAAAKSPLRLRKILVPLDFSDCSLKALKYALALARQFGGELTLLHVVEAAFYATDPSLAAPMYPEEEMRLFAEKKLAMLARSALGDQVPAALLVRLGQPVVEISALAREANIDLIVISTHGNTGLKHFLLGSVAENVVRHAPCPVLVVREHEHEFLADAPEAIAK